MPVGAEDGAMVDPGPELALLAAPGVDDAVPHAAAVAAIAQATIKPPKRDTGCRLKVTLISSRARICRHDPRRAGTA
jgi:hypothetical protein